MLKYSAVILSAILLQIDLIYGQPQAVIDSIEMSLSVEQGNARPSTLYELAFEYSRVDTDKALAVCIRAEQAALKAGDTLLIVKSRRLKGQLLYLMDRNYEAAESLYQVLPIAVRYGLKSEQLSILAIL